jgi:hypothetical protein
MSYKGINVGFLKSDALKINWQVDLACSSRLKEMTINHKNKVGR